jgi:hypothetical protein
MGKTMRESAFALTEAKYAAGDFRHTVFDSVESVSRSFKIIANKDLLPDSIVTPALSRSGNQHVLSRQGLTLKVKPRMMTIILWQQQPAMLVMLIAKTG